MLRYLLPLALLCACSPSVDSLFGPVAGTGGSSSSSSVSSSSSSSSGGACDTMQCEATCWQLYNLHCDVAACACFPCDPQTCDQTCKGKGWVFGGKCIAPDWCQCGIAP